MLLMIAGIAFAAIPRSPFWMGQEPARAAALAAADSTAVTPDSLAAPANTGAARADTSAARADSSAARADTTAALADTTAAGAFAAEAPETLRFIPPPGLEPPPAALPAAPPVETTKAEEPEQAYGPLPKGVTTPGESPKGRAGLWGLHPAAIIAALVVVHVLVVRAVTR